MTRRYATPPAFKQALEARLRAHAEQSGMPLQRVRQLVIFDRILARMVTSFGGSVILKGGLALELRLQKARATKDIDVRAVGDPATFLDRLQEAGRLDLGDFMTFEVRLDRKHPELEGLEYGGRRYRAEARLAGKLYGAAFGIDVVFAEPMTGEIETLVGSDLLAFAGIAPTPIRTYPLEAHIAEKLHALTLPRSRSNSRVKDLPDLALLGTIRPIGGTDLRSAIETTFASRGTHDIPTSIPDPPATWARIYERLATETALPWPDLPAVLEDARRFIDPALAADPGTWDPITRTWSRQP